jgi:mRNA interferase YafQ
MRELEYTTQFERDYKREKKSKSGKGLTLGECHIKPDLLLIYEKRGKSVLVLIRLGSHSELF